MDRYVPCFDQVLPLSGILFQVKLWELRSNMNPLRSYNEHKAEVYSVDWNPVSKELFVSGSWDNTVKVGETYLTAFGFADA